MAVLTNLTVEEAAAIPEPKTVQTLDGVCTVFTEDTVDVTPATSGE